MDIAIKGLKKHWDHKMVSKNCPRRVWEFGLKHSAKVIHMIPPEKINVITTIEAMTGETPDISEYVDFGVYDVVW